MERAEIVRKEKFEKSQEEIYRICLSKGYSHEFCCSNLAQDYSGCKTGEGEGQTITTLLPSDK